MSETLRRIMRFGLSEIEVEFPLHRHSPGRDESGRVVAIVKDSGVERSLNLHSMQWNDRRLCRISRDGRSSSKNPHYEGILCVCTRMLCAARAHTIGHAPDDSAAVGRLSSAHPNAEIRRKRLHLPSNASVGCAVLSTGP
ncbi:hypothetical protein NP493_334g03063 [Ridgeia piscesae]|uniref:Uncharacterized protein n=1 Tax=Ridgeia piscesae TaxID=27915 RepID=A0AAD9L4N9_RIDPI|nr:hypothetical protein NP493_334g03063 [Ridgeia piscesae]